MLRCPSRPASFLQAPDYPSLEVNGAWSYLSNSSRSKQKAHWLADYWPLKWTYKYTEVSGGSRCPSEGPLAIQKGGALPAASSMSVHAMWWVVALQRALFHMRERLPVELKGVGPIRDPTRFGSSSAIANDTLRFAPRASVCFAECSDCCTMPSVWFVKN